MLPSDWIDNTNERLRRGRIVWPENRDQLVWLVENHPEYALRVLPPRSEMRYLGLPASFGRMKSYSETTQERLVQTVVECPTFAAALRVALQIGGAA